MARTRRAATELSPWHRRGLIIPPDSPREWLRLAIWEVWMGMLLTGLIAFGALLIGTARDRIVIGVDLSGCYATTVVLPCERILYRTGALNAAFGVLCGVLLLAAAVWLLWELWSAAEPLPITDDFLKLLNDSFGRNWRNPRTWPWTRVLWAYGFTSAGVMLTFGVVVLLSMLLSSAQPSRAPAPNVDTSQRFRVSP
jgi:hypothetical protein